MKRNLHLKCETAVIISCFQVALDDSEMQVCPGNKTKKEQRKNRLTLTAIFDCVRHCGKQGIALRGHGNEKKSGNIWNLLWLLGRYNADINTYLNSDSSTKYLSPDVQNEMLKILSQMIL